MQRGFNEIRGTSACNRSKMCKESKVERAVFVCIRTPYCFWNNFRISRIIRISVKTDWDYSLRSRPISSETSVCMHVPYDVPVTCAILCGLQYLRSSDLAVRGHFFLGLGSFHPNPTNFHIILNKNLENRIQFHGADPPVNIGLRNSACSR